MAISLLWSNRATAASVPLSEKLIYRLSLDRAFAYVCADVKKRERFFEILSQWPVCAEDVRMRQAICRDFLDNPDLLERLSALCARFEELCLSQQQTDREARRLRANQLDTFHSAKNILQARALCLKRALLFVKAFDELLTEFAPSSAAIRTFAAACREITEGDAFSELVTLCAKYEQLGSSGFTDLKLTWDSEGRIAYCELIDHRYIRVADPDLRKKGFSLFKREAQEYPCERVRPPYGDAYANLAREALSDLSDTFAAVINQLWERFGRICSELHFYEVAMQYLTMLKRKNIPYCLPIITDGEMYAERLYDLYLAASAENASEVVPNDVCMHEMRGMVVYGGNGSGKTVYLRSIGTMQLLAQAGIPVPCEQAHLPLCTQIAAQFSEAEKEFCAENEAGRFEQEVRELAEMVDTLQDGALVLLNETFQSTAYAEGAEGLYHLLRYFSDRGIRWVLVSHLHPLEQMLCAHDVVILHTSKGFRMK